jgi:CBS domain-containing protein
MGATARDYMSTKFYTLLPQTPLVDAMRVFEKVNAGQQTKVFGMMVINEQEELVGMLSMYDILLLIRPKHIHIWGEMSDIDVTGIIKESCRRAKAILVGDIMTTEVLTISPDTHVLLIVDIMIKKHVRRLPVVENGKVVGIVYLSAVFHHLMERLIND